MFSFPDALRPRKEAIDHQLASAGWSLLRGNISEHFLLPASGDRSTYADYVLVDSNKMPLGVVECRQSSRDLLDGERQALDYAGAIETHYGFKPFLYLADGERIWFADPGRMPLRPVSSFHSPADLARLDFQRRAARPLDSLQASPEIISLPYQFEAVRRIAAAFQAGQRRCLLALAGATDKIRTTLALVELLLRAGWTQRVLFLTNRRDLFRQALRETAACLPNSAGFDPGERFHISTYPAMTQIFPQLSIGAYDLIVADESQQPLDRCDAPIFQHFDALLLGLTTTPADFIDQAVYQLFGCPDGRPTFCENYPSAVEAGSLVPYRAIKASIQFKISAVKPGRLPARLLRQLAEQRLEASDFSFEATELERRVSNAGTSQAIVQEMVERCRLEDGDSLPAKTIVYAMGRTHAFELLRAFDTLYPHWHGQAAVVDQPPGDHRDLWRAFKQANEPRIAITSGLPDAGDDLGCAQNLVLARPVFSPAAFWQIIATANAAGEHRRELVVLDFWGNFDFFALKPGEDAASLDSPLPTRLFRLRLDKLTALQAHSQPAAIIQATTARLQSMLASLPEDALALQPFVEELHHWQSLSTWAALDAESLARLRFILAPLMRYLPDASLEQMDFELRCEQLALAQLADDREAIRRLRESILHLLDCLPAETAEGQGLSQWLARVRSDAFWGRPDCQKIDAMAGFLAPLVGASQTQPRQTIHLDLPGRIVSQMWIVYGPGNDYAGSQPYRDQVEARVRELSEHYPALRKIQQGAPLSDEDLKTLAYLLDQSGLATIDPILRQAYQRPNAYFFDFLRHVLTKIQIPNQEDVISLAFEQFIASRQPLDESQLAFIRLARSFAFRRARLTAQDFKHTPFIRVGQVDQLFTPQQQVDLIEFSNQFAPR